MTPRVVFWLRQPTAVSNLHIFDQTINLIDEAGEIISVVQPAVGPGPFSLVVEEKRPFSALLSPREPVKKTASGLKIGPLMVDLSAAKRWHPTPPWELVRGNRHQWQSYLAGLQTAVTAQADRLLKGSPGGFAPAFYEAITATQQALRQPKAPGLAMAVSRLAGLGPGLTPAGDDYLLGLLLGLWATRPEDQVNELAKIVLGTAVPRTTHLSAAWLKTAVQGEAAFPWHALLEAFIAGTNEKAPFNDILNTGATSGIAALLGFLSGASPKNAFDFPK